MGTTGNWRTASYDCDRAIGHEGTDNYAVDRIVAL